jgi:hypothetical protein
MASSTRSTRRQTGGVGNMLSSGVTAALRQTVATVREQADEQASQLTRTLRERGQSMLDRQKQLVASEISHLGAAVRRASGNLQDQNSPTLAQYVDNAARRLDGMARYVEDSDLGELGREIEQFVRRRPAVIVGGMFLTGLAIGRFVKASRPAAPPPRRPQASSPAGRKRPSKRGSSRQSARTGKGD